MKTKTIKLLAAWEGIDTGAILKVDEKTAEELIEAKTAELYDEEAEKRAKEALEADNKRLTMIVKDAIAETIKQADGDPEQKATRHIQVHERIDDDPKHGFKSFGEFTTAVVEGSAQGVTPDKRLLVDSKASGMSVGIDSDGGFLVPEEFSNDLLRKTYEAGAVVSRCRRVPMSTKYLTIPYIVESSRADGSRHGGVRVYRKAEAAQATSSKTAIGRLKLTLNKLVGLAYDTEELMRFSPVSAEALLSQLFAEEFAFAIDNEIINGTGGGQCLGILNAPCKIEVAKEAGQLADTIVFENVAKMWSRLYARSRANAVWFVNQDCEYQLMTMAMVVGTGGVPVYMPASGVSGSPYSTLFGRPVIPIEQAATVGDNGDIILADMSQYLYAEHTSGMEGATSIHLRFDYGETAMRWVMYNDGQPWWASALTPYKGTATQSPIVTLAARA